MKKNNILNKKTIYNIILFIESNLKNKFYNKKY